MRARFRTVARSTFVVLLVASGAATAAAGNSSSHVGKAYPVSPFTVKGSIALSENSSTNTLTVKLDLRGFKPNSRHVMHVHKGLMCANMAMGGMPSPTMGPILVPLGVHRADGSGQMKLAFTVKHAPKLKFGAIHVMVHYGPNINTPSNARPMTCADIP